MKDVNTKKAEHPNHILRNARLSLGMKSQEAAAAIGVTKNTYLMWERGELTPMPDKTEKVAQVLRLPLESVPVGGKHKPYSKRPMKVYDEDTMQAKAMKLMGSKLAVASLIEGNFSDEGLASMGDEKDLTSQMAKELTLGIKDSVEDIAATFKKMAFVNPDRKPRQRLVPKPEAEVIDLEPVQTDSGVKYVQHRQMQEIYEGLLAKSREQKKNKGRAEVENQISLFDSAA